MRFLAELWEFTRNFIWSNLRCWCALHGLWDSPDTVGSGRSQSASRSCLEPLVSRIWGAEPCGCRRSAAGAADTESHWHGEPLRRRAGRPVWGAPGQRAAEDRRGKCTGTESAPSLLLTWRGDVDVSTAGCGVLPSKLKLEPLLRRLKVN